MKRVVLTGATGFIGRWCVQPLLEKGYEVHLITSRPESPLPKETLGAQAHCVDLFDAGSVYRLLSSLRASHLMHFAWIATPGMYWNSTANISWVAASLEMLRAFQELGGVRTVFAGTCAEYDWGRAEVCNESETPLATDGARLPSLYACSKVGLQKMQAAFGRGTGMSAAWGRIFHQYGPYEHPARLVSSVILHLLKDRVAKCTHGRQIRNFMHVKDVGSAFAALLDSSVEGPVNIGSVQRVKLRDILSEISTQLGRPDLVQLGARAEPPGEPAVLVPDVNRLYVEVGWRPALTLEHGLADAIAWHRGNSA